MATQKKRDDEDDDETLLDDDQRDDLEWDDVDPADRRKDPLRRPG